MDQLREDTRERTWEDYVETAGAVLAVGAGAALFLRNGGARQVTRAARFLDSYRTSLSKRFLDNPVRDFESLESTILDNLSNAARDALTIDEQGATLGTPVLEGVVADVHSAIRRSIDNTADSTIRNDILTSHRQEIARNTLQRIQEQALNSMPDMALDEAEYAGMERLGSRFASSNKMVGPKEAESAISEMTSDAVSYEKMRRYAEAIQEELQRNEKELTDTENWNFVERAVTGFDENGFVQFGNIAREFTEDQGLWENAEKDLDRNWGTIVERQQAAKNWVSNLIDQAWGNKATMGDLMERYERQDAEVMSLFDSDNVFPVPISKEIKGGPPSALTNPFQDIYRTWQGMGESERNLFNQIELDSLRIQNGHLYSTQSIENARRSLLDNLGNTLPGRLLRINDMRYEEDLPVRQFFAAGTVDRSLASALGLKGNRIDRDILYMRGRSYEMKNGQLTEIEALRDYVLQSSRVGSQAEIFRAVNGMEHRNIADRNIDGVKFAVKEVSEEYGNNLEFFRNAIDDPMGNVARRRLIRDGGYFGARTINRIDRFFHTWDRYVSADAMDAQAYRNLKQWYEQSGYKTDSPDGKPSTITKIIDTLADISGPEGEKALYKHMGMPGSLDTAQQFMSPKLQRLYSDFWKNQQRTIKQSIVHADQAKLKDATAYVIENFPQNVQKELLSELFLQMNSQFGTNAVEEMIGSTLKGERRKNIRNLAAYAMLQQRIERNASGAKKSDVAINFLNELDTIGAQRNTGENKFIFDAFQDVYERFNFPGEAKRVAPQKEIFRVPTTDYHYVHKAYTFTGQTRKVRELIRDANAYYIDADGKRQFDPIMAGQLYPKDLKRIAQEALKPITQFFSGNDIFDAYSSVSHRGYHIMSRVNDQLAWTKHFFGRQQELDLRLRPENAGSAAAIMSNLVLRRALPAAMLYNALDWTDDTVRYFTGSGIVEAGASGLANSYLGVKRLTGGLGLDPYIKSVTSDNIALQYWSGLSGSEKSEWNTYEEQKDYYERGYTAIRKNRGWWFGSSNEIRGNQIAYFEPNTLRMLRSNYYMESMYNGSMWKKWSHSLMPTPTNPLSPLFYLADPYYLEEMHKEDRPYPITGSTFADNTPWGVALNPIFDNFIKQPKQLHKDRLGSSGVDIRALIAHVNDDIRRRSLSKQDDNIIYLQNGKLRSMLFTAFNAPTPSERIIGSQGTSVTMATEYGEYGSGISGEEYTGLIDQLGQPEEGANFGYGTTVGSLPIEDDKLVTGQPVDTDRLTISDRLVLSAGKGNPIASQLVSTLKQNGVFNILRGANLDTMRRGALRKDQGFFYENKMQYEHSTIDDMLANSETVADLLTQGKGSDYVHEMTVATRNITGLYGYLASLATGFGENNQKRIATSQNMESFSRQFWDWSVGGMDIPGSDVMEIGRRFVPNYQRQAMVNPLMNTMPDWLPERLRFGDPFASIPKGEARLPGRGYESLNQLHPDIYGRYGAFDRFKILADVAPYSPEYKFWKKVVGATITDPKLKEEIQEIKDRVAQQTSRHDFYDYKFVGRGLDERRATISEVMGGGKFKVDGSDQVYKLSGVSVKAGPNGESTQDVLGQYLYAGQEVTLAIDQNRNYAANRDKDNSINAAVLINDENLSDIMLERGEARRRKGDTSASSYMLKHGMITNGLNTITEFIAHADVPVWHSRIMKVDTPLESYKDDYVYGTSYQSWGNLWGSFLKPNLQKFSSSSSWMAIGIAAEIINNNMQNRGLRPQMLREITEGVLGHEINVNLKERWLSHLASYTLNRGRLAGELIGHGLLIGSSGELSAVNKFMEAGSTIALGWAAMANPNDLAISTMSWSRLGWKAAEMVNPNKRFTASLIGAGIGLVRWAYAQKMLASNDLASTYVPEDAKKRWDMQEYFDRLTYIKYMGLYEQAADKAEEEEGVNVRKIMIAQDKERKERNEMRDMLRNQLNEMNGRNDQEAEEARSLIRRKLREGAPKVGMRGGEWTKTAIMYKNAADATMYGLDENAVMADIVRALPKTERDYFIEFMKEKDPEKREEILKTVSPLLNRALRTIWKMPLPERVSNEEYFEHHPLPAPTWSGWRPDVDLANVEAKVIYNQGMQFSDMGVYASQYRTPEVQNAPNIEYETSQNSSLLTRLKLQMAITGMGIDADKISVEPSPDSTIQVIANVARIVPYKINYEIDNFLRRI